MNAKPPVVLKVLLQHRHLQTHSAFSREYDRVAAGIDPILRGGGPSKAQFYRWLAGKLIGLPYSGHRRVLEGMFPGWRVGQLFQTHDGGTELIPGHGEANGKVFTDLTDTEWNTLDAFEDPAYTLAAVHILPLERTPSHTPGKVST